MSGDIRSHGLAMMVVGLLIVFGSVAMALMTEEPLPTALGVIGIVAIAVGSRRRRQG